MNITSKDIVGVAAAVTKQWTRQRKAEERGARTQNSRQYVYSGRVNFTDVAEDILPAAYDHASGGGTFPVAKRQFYYACREKFREQTGREITYVHFANTLLVQFMNRNSWTDSWKVTADPRGTLVIPNCGHEERIPCGTIQIGDHLRDAGDFDAHDIDGLRTEWPSLSAGQRYQGVLYIEKEGFEPVMREARIAERFDLAIMSCKGQSVVAARRFVDEVCRENGGVPLFVAHDFDKSGFEISQRLTAASDWARENDRVTYEFQNTIDVTDLGLRLTDVEEYGLADEHCEFSGHFANDSTCTDEEKEFLRSNRRVELNAFTSPQFVDWLETRLAEHLTSRLIPNDEILKAAFRRASAAAEVNAAIDRVRENAVANAAGVKVPDGLREMLRKKLESSRGAWDEVVYDLAKQALFCDDE